MADDEVELALSATDLWRLAEALDSHEYWQLGDVLPRDNGEVWIPGDLPSDHDRYWSGVDVTIEQQEAIDEVRACRSLRKRLLQARENLSHDESKGP